MLQQLSQLSGEEFDRQYMQEQVQDHQAAVKLFGSEATQPSGPVDQLAGELLPTLREHQQMAQETSKSIGEEKLPKLRLQVSVSRVYSPARSNPKQEWTWSDHSPISAGR
jgi:Domain of unknown function (DUF4142)